MTDQEFLTECDRVMPELLITGENSMGDSRTEVLERDKHRGYWMLTIVYQVDGQWRRCGGASSTIILPPVAVALREKQCREWLVERGVDCIQHNGGKRYVVVRDFPKGPYTHALGITGWNDGTLRPFDDYHSALLAAVEAAKAKG